MRKIFVVRRYFYDGDCYTQYNDIAFYTDREKADSKCAELVDEDPYGVDEYKVDECTLID